MKIVNILVVLFAFWAVCGNVLADDSAERIRVACVGDSITFGDQVKQRTENCYPAVLGRALGDKYDVRNFGACGASGVAGGSLLLIPMACSLFGISNDVAMQVVGVGFIIGVIQDSVETALNSAGDVEFAATAEYHQWLKQGKPLPEFLSGKKN